MFMGLKKEEYRDDVRAMRAGERVSMRRWLANKGIDIPLAGDDAYDELCSAVKENGGNLSTIKQIGSKSVAERIIRQRGYTNRRMGRMR